MLLSSTLIALSLFATSYGEEVEKRCTGTISSLADVAAAVQCTTIVINGFTVPAGQTFNLNLLAGTSVTVAGDIAFGNLSWAGPLFEIRGTSITFNGNGHTFDGGGPFYWDGLGGNGGVQKPVPMMTIGMSGTFTNLKVRNSPQRAFAITNPAPLVMSALTVDNSQGSLANSKSAGKPAGANTDGFDVASNDLTIMSSTVTNQDDCLAINRGSNIVFTGNTCTGAGHGISIGSITSSTTVSGVVITNNNMVNSVNGIRIKTDAVATGSTVTNVTYSGNKASGITGYGVLIDQSYPAVLGTPGSGVKLSGVNFVGTANTFSVASTAKRVAVNCGSGSCSGTWNWGALTVTGGTAGTVNYGGISGGSF